MNNHMTCKGIRYVIRQGDSLYKISRIYRVPLAMLLKANPYVDVYNLQVGDEICIPLMPQPVEMPDNRPGNRPGEGMSDNRPGNRPGEGMSENRPGNRPGESMSENRPGNRPDESMPEPENWFGNRPSDSMPENQFGKRPSENMSDNRQLGNNQSNRWSEVRSDGERMENPSSSRSGSRAGITEGLSYTPTDTEEEMMIYVVQSGDTLEGILERFALSIEELLHYNQLGNVLLQSGSTLEIPQRGMLLRSGSAPETSKVRMEEQPCCMDSMETKTQQRQKEL